MTVFGPKVFSYAEIEPITTYVPPRKQAVKRHYGSHQYFTKRAWNVVQAYIEHFTQPNDVVCDPYGGSGVTVVEALVLNRKGIYVDISEWARFLAEEVAKAPIDIQALGDAFHQVESACAERINEWCKLPDAEVSAIPIKRWYPKDYPLPRNADVRFVENLFTHRQLLALSELYHHIRQVEDQTYRDLLRYAFSATLYMCNRTFISAKGRKESRGGSSIFSIFRYKVAKRPVELNPWTIFHGRVNRLIASKKETNLLVGLLPEGSRDAKFIKGFAQRLTEYVQPESVDYIFTDPPYGAHIAYLDLTAMWDAWLGFKITNEDKQEETIEAGDADHSPEHFKRKLAEGIGQMFKVLKYDRWLSLVFSHREPAMWDTIVKAFEAAGFEYVNTVGQPLSVIWSMHKKKNPLTVLSGELILNFRKVRNPRTLAITSVGSDAVSIIKDSAELSIVQNNGATTDQVYGDVIPKLLENGLLGEVSSKIGDITPILNQEYSYDSENKTWHIKPGRKLGCHIPLEHRIRFYVTDYLNHVARLGKHATIDDIVLTVLPKLKNGEQPRKQKIVEEMRKFAAPVDGKYWVLREAPQHVFEFEAPIAESKLTVPARKPESDYTHNEILYTLAMLSQSAGFTFHVGKKEQAAEWNGQQLSEISVKSLPFLRGADSFTKDKVVQIDLIWLNGARPVLAFEIEHTTPITTALDRFIELLKLDMDLVEKLIIVAPQSRQKKMNQVLGSSHYIGAPMYMDTKVRYLWYADVLDIASHFSNQQPTKVSLTEVILRTLHIPNARPKG
ncbi:MAG: DNA methyltransferase [Candidatus Acidiferrales bacterium]